MEKVLVEKHDGVIKTSMIDGIDLQNCVIKQDDDCLKDVIDFTLLESATDEQIKGVKKSFDKIINLISRYAHRNMDMPDVIDDAMNAIIVSDSKDKLISMVQRLLKDYASFKNFDFDKNFKLIQNVLENNPDIVLGIFVKGIVYNYYLNLIKNCNKECIAKLVDMKKNNSSFDDMLSYIGKSLPEGTHQNGVYDLSKRMFDSAFNDYYIKGQEHLCTDCKNFLRCPKVLSEFSSSNLSDYDFITDGVQINEDGETSTLIVTGCDKYVHEKNVKRNGSYSLSQLKELRDSFYEDSSNNDRKGSAGRFL